MRSSPPPSTEVPPSRFLDRLIPGKRFSRFSIARKILFGYMVLVLCTIVVVAYALYNLQRLNSLNDSIVTTDVFVYHTAEEMLETIIAQDGHEKRYLLLKSPEMQRAFFMRGEEFRTWLDSLNKLPDPSNLPLATISALHQEYTDLFSREVKLVQSGRVSEASRISNGDLKAASEQLIRLLRGMVQSAYDARVEKMQQARSIGRTAFIATAALSAAAILLGILASLAVTHHISSSLAKLTVATSQIAEGNFSYDPQITSADEVGTLAAAFVDMGKRLRKMEEMYLDASPLTRLPGGIAIENVVKKRLASGQPFAFCLVDLDNFKSYSDRYGYVRGSELLKEVAHIIEDAVAARGSSEDFIGHIGGDDFVVITMPERMRTIGDEIIARFDERIPGFYDEADRKNGFIIGKTRHGQEIKFPILTISISIVTNERRTTISPFEVSAVAAELKEYAKAIPKSVYVVDQRSQK